MMLGQPETAAEHAAEQARMLARQQARQARYARMVAEIRAEVSRGDSLDAACLRAARRHKLGKGGARAAREMYNDKGCPDAG